MISPLTPQQCDDIETRATRLAEYARQDDGEGDTLAGIDVPALLATVRRLTAELGTARSEAMREAADLVHKTTAPDDWSPDAVACWNTALNIAEHRLRQDIATVLPPRRTLSEGEYNAAWHAVEGAAGEEGADPGTILHAVLNRLGIALPGAVEPKAEEQSVEACGKCRAAFDPADTRFDGHARYYLTPYCKRCVDACHDNEIADHRCVICA